jgi:hypothetical protein
VVFAHPISPIEAGFPRITGSGVDFHAFYISRACTALIEVGPAIKSLGNTRSAWQKL